MTSVYANAVDNVSVITDANTDATSDGSDTTTSESEKDGKFEFRLLDDDTYEVFCPEENKDKLTGELVIPAEYNGKPVSRVNRFDGCNNITSVVIENGITELGLDAFISCGNLETVTIPKSLVKIEHSAFFGAQNLTTIKVDADNTAFCSVDGVLFSKDKTVLICYPAGKADTSYTVPDTVTELGVHAFAMCNAITEIAIPASVVKMGDDLNVFRGSFALRAVKIDEANNSYCTVDNVVFSKDKTTLIAYLPTKIDEEYTVPDSVTVVLNDAFFLCDNLKKLNFNEGLLNLGSISNCCYINSLTISKSVKHFTGIVGMDRLFEINYGGTKSEWQALIADFDEVSMECLRNVRVRCAPDMVDAATGLAFKLLDDGTYEVYCPADKKESLTGELVIPAEYNGERVSRIASQGFSGCQNITSVKIENGITEIRELVFSGCGKLETISIPASAEKTNFSFSFISSLKSVTVDEANEYYFAKDGILFSKDKTKLIVYPAGRPDTSYTIPDSVTVICDSSFSDCNNLVEVIIPESVKEIENHAFAHSNMLQSVNIPASVEKMGENNIFSGCENVQVTIDESNKSFIINDGVIFTSDVSELVAYLSSKSDEEYKVPESVRRIRGDAFSMNQHIKALVLNDGLTQFSNIQNCWNLKSITIPKSVTTFEGISGMDSFKEIFYGGKMAEWLEVKSNHRLDPDGVLERVKVVCSDGAFGIAPDFDENEGVFIPGVNPKDVEKMDVETVEIVQGLTIKPTVDGDLKDAELYAKPDTTQVLIPDGLAIDLSFIKDGVKVQPEAKVTVDLPIPESLRNAVELFIYHITDGNGIEAIIPDKVDRENNILTFSATHFSTYVFTDTKQTGNNGSTEDSSDESGDSGSSGTTSSGSSNSDTSNSDSVSSGTTSSTPSNSDTASSNGDSTSNNSGTISADVTDSNPSTGIAVSALPVLVALGAAVIVIKKRK